ncbi:diguanylate cyclase [Photobacterium sp. WH77]|uniref:diguanylate cyclase domain-containing protein n=1 Tax=unclassified Photobacterium TaxID=2628852 RepID=UPI001C491BC8|nr:MULTISPECIES: diguanylate cyclase [unclassified Photobacterium]MBV7263625.1 diguanylate cyclase [Photobacterium sp. WH24]MCG2836500.1 diguanylate cyclase [Photobacterium sp. WH77]MCG2843873.1 diguanylate cyclase [Photobacterium sp. WH80]
MRNQFLKLFILLAGFAPVITCASHQDPLRQPLADHEPWATELISQRVSYCFNPAWRPYDYQEQEQHKGIFADYLHLIERYLGVTFHPYFTSSWSESLTALQLGHCDFIPAISQTPEREKYLSFTSPYYQIHNVLVAKADKPMLTSLDELAGQSIAGPKHTAVMTRLQHTHPEIQQVYAATPLQAMHLLNAGEVYAFVAPLDSLIDELKEDVFRKKIIAKLDFSLPVAVGVRLDKPELLRLLNMAVQSITPEEHREISRKWTQFTITERHNFTDIYRWSAVSLVIILVLGFWITRLQDEIKKHSQTEARLRHMANHDALTNLPTLRYAQEKIDSAILRCQRSNTNMALMFVDLDGFKDVNDTFGHDAGDKLLKAVSIRLVNSLRETDTVARIGGDEFILILENIASTDTTTMLADKILTMFSRPFMLTDNPLHLGVSIGVSMYPSHGTTRESLLKHADQAMYCAKKNGKNQCQFALAQQQISAEKV